MPFKKEKWNIKQDIFYDYREFMIDDLLSKNIIIGKNFEELENIFGDLKIEVENNEKYISQNVITDFGFDIDPIKTVDLLIYLDKNDIAVKTELVKWEK